MALRSVPLGLNWRKSRLVFSSDQSCHKVGEDASAFSMLDATLLSLTMNDCFGMLHRSVSRRSNDGIGPRLLVVSPADAPLT